MFVEAHDNNKYATTFIGQNEWEKNNVWPEQRLRGNLSVQDIIVRLCSWLC